MQIRRATWASLASLVATVAAAATAAAVAADAWQWSFYRHNLAVGAAMQARLSARGLTLPPLPNLPKPRFADAVSTGVFVAALAGVLAAAAWLLARGGRRWAALALAALPLLGEHGPLAPLPLLVPTSFNADPTMADRMSVVGYALVVALPVVVLLALGRRQLPRPAGPAGRTAVRSAPVAVGAALVAYLATASDDHGTAMAATVLAVGAGAALATSGYRRSWLALATLELLIVAGLEAVPDSEGPSWSVPGVGLTAAALLLAGALAGRGEIGRAWVWALRRGPAARPARQPAA